MTADGACYPQVAWLLPLVVVVVCRDLPTMVPALS
jgi:hypothetical protein